MLWKGKALDVAVQAGRMRNRGSKADRASSFNTDLISRTPQMPDSKEGLNFSGVWVKIFSGKGRG